MNTILVNYYENMRQLSERVKFNSVFVFDKYHFQSVCKSILTSTKMPRKKITYVPFDGCQLQRSNVGSSQTSQDRIPANPFGVRWGDPLKEKEERDEKFKKMIESIRKMEEESALYQAYYKQSCSLYQRNDFSNKEISREEYFLRYREMLDQLHISHANVSFAFVCGHCYHPLRGSKVEKIALDYYEENPRIISAIELDKGCAVCWRILNCPKPLQDFVNKFIDDLLHDTDGKNTYCLHDIHQQRLFYRFLFKDRILSFPEWKKQHSLGETQRL